MQDANTAGARKTFALKNAFQRLFWTRLRRVGDLIGRLFLFFLICFHGRAFHDRGALQYAFALPFRLFFFLALVFLFGWFFFRCHVIRIGAGRWRVWFIRRRFVFIIVFLFGGGFVFLWFRLLCFFRFGRGGLFRLEVSINFFLLIELAFHGHFMFLLAEGFTALLLGIALVAVAFFIAIVQ